MKTVKIVLNDIKDSDQWMELVHELLFDKFKKEHPKLDEDELGDEFYTKVVKKKFRYGEYADLEIIFDENLNIVGGKIL
jgi:hypothetical protein